MKSFKSIKSQKGFVPILVIIAVLSLAYILLTGNGREWLSRIGIKNIGEQSATSASEYTDGSFFYSRELGYKFKLNAELKTQQLTFFRSGNQIHFSSQAIENLDSHCSPSTPPETGAFGTIIKYAGTSDPNRAWASGPTWVKQLDGFYLEYYHPQADCGRDPSKSSAKQDLHNKAAFGSTDPSSDSGPAFKSVRDSIEQIR